MKELGLELLRACIRVHPLGCRDCQLLIRFSSLSSTRDDPLLQCFGEMPHLAFRPLLAGEIAADGGDVHRSSRVRIVDTKPLDEEWNRLAALEMPERYLAGPPPDAHHSRPQLLAHARTLVWHNEVEHVQSHGFLQAAESHQLQPGWIDILRHAVQAVDADELR